MANIAYDVHIDNVTYSALVSDSQKLADVKTILETKFPDDTCALVAIKSILGIEEKEDTDPVDPVDP